jgi:hypothetical protein
LSELDTFLSAPSHLHRRGQDPKCTCGTNVIQVPDGGVIEDRDFAVSEAVGTRQNLSARRIAIGVKFVDGLSFGSWKR